MWKEMVDLGVALGLGWLLDTGSSSSSICVYKGVLGISPAGTTPCFTLLSVLHGVDPFPFLLLNANRSSFILRRMSVHEAHMHYRSVKNFILFSCISRFVGKRRSECRVIGTDAAPLEQIGS